MPDSGLFEPVESLKGVGPATGRRLREAGLARVVDLLLLLPARYQERRRAPSLAEAPFDGTVCMVEAEVERVGVAWFRRRRGSRVTARLRDGMGRGRATWFNQPWVRERLEQGRVVRLAGTVREGPGGEPELLNPKLLDPEGPWPEDGLMPVYPTVAGMRPSRVERLVAAALACLPELADPLKEVGLAGVEVPALGEALDRLHRPGMSLAPGEAAAFVTRSTPWHRRLVLDELLLLSAAARRRRERRRRWRGPVCAVPGERIERLIRALPFELTPAQRRVLSEIVGDLAGPGVMARLLQGDVGSGKTVVAGLAAAVVALAGHQAALMAPTDVLARQHAAGLARVLAPAGLEPVLLTGALQASERRAALESIASGRARLVVGTHALFQEEVRFRRLGLVIVDEQHRFGVLQRRALWEKGRSPHLLVMTATPIPRSLAQTLYGDLDLCVLDELPPGRHPVRTFVRDESAREKVLDFLERELAAGGRVFVVYPRIGEGGQGGGLALERAAPTMRERFRRFGVAVAHGRMDPAARDAALGAFRSGSAAMLLATTVVEVGVDVPEATVMVVESAERFGLSQLHQLRGRVGRGSPRKPWCILMAGEGCGAAARRRLEMLAATRDGFEVAEKDLELRGPGELEGVRQWGPTGGRFLDIARHPDLIPQAVGLAEELARRGRLEEVLSGLERIYRGG